VYDSNELIECRVHLHVSILAAKITLHYDFHAEIKEIKIHWYCINQSQVILNIDNILTYIYMYACKLVVVLFFFRIYICTHSYSRDPVNEHECAFVWYFILNFTSHTHTHAHGRCQTNHIRLFMSSFWFIHHAKSRPFLYTFDIYSVQLSTNHKSYTHTRICILICLKLEIENWKIVITPSILEISSILFFLTHTHIYTCSHCKRTSGKTREREKKKKKEKKVVKRWTLFEKKKPPTSCECHANAYKSYIVQWEARQIERKGIKPYICI
jgi:hypothetical protein